MSIIFEPLQLLAILILFIFFGFLIFEFKSFKFKFLDLPIYLTIAISVLSLIYFLLRFINVPFVVISLLIFLPILPVFLKTSFEEIKIKKKLILFICFLIIGTLVISGNGFFEGYTDDKNILISTTKDNDALWHIALQESIKKSIPPINPIFASEKIKNYHYLTDVFFSFLSELTHISTVNVFLKWSPFVLSFLFISTTYLLLYQITKKISLSYLGSSLIFFSSSLSYLVPHFFKNGNSSQSVFWLDQSTRYLVNPQLMLSLIVINVIFFLCLKSLKKYWIIIAILIGSLIGIKVYSFIVILGAFFLVGLYYLVKDKNWQYLRVACLGLTLGILIVFLAGVNSSFPFIFLPGWFIGSMYQSSDRLNYPDWEIHRQLFLQTSNYRRLIIHWLLGIFIFFVGNFGLKILGLPLGLILIKKVNKLEPIILLSMVVLSLSIIFPMLFLQKGIVWNTIQFLHYAQLPLVILISYFVMRFKIKYQIILLTFILLAGLPTTVAEVKQNFQIKSYSVYDSQLIEGLGMINRIVPEDRKIVVGSNLYNSSVVPAFAKREVFYSAQHIIDILLIDSSERIAYIEKLENGIKICKENEIFVAGEKPASISGQMIFKNNKVSIIRCSD